MEKGKLIRSTGIISGFTMLSRLLGLARDILMAGFFGTSLVMDAFFVAFTAPNLFRRLFGEGALSSAFVPVLVETREKEGDETAWEFINRVLSLALVVLSAITVLLILVAALIHPATPKNTMVLSLFRVMMPYMVFICLAAISMGILNSFHHFAMPAFAPSILNLVWIATLLFAVPNIGNTPEEKIRCVAWAVVVSGFLQWAVLWPVLRRYGWKPRFSNVWKTKRIHKMLLLMGPAALGMAVLQINVIIDRLLAWWVGVGAPSALFFSERLIYLPLGLIATALGTVLLPVFSGHASRSDFDQIRDSVTDSLRHLLFVMIPAAAGLLVLAGPIVQMIFEWREFDATSTWMTSIALQCYAPGLVVFSLSKIFVPAFYGMQDTKTPFRVGVFSLLLNTCLSVTFILTLPQGVKHAGIAFATVLSETFGMTVLVMILQKRIGRLDWKRVGATAARSVGAVILMVVTVLFVYSLFPMVGIYDAIGVKTGQIVAVLVSIAAGGGIYLIASILFRSAEIREFTSALRR